MARRAPRELRSVVSEHGFLKVLESACSAFYSNCTIPRGIAPTRGLKENMWATAVCVQVCMYIRVLVVLKKLLLFVVDICIHTPNIHTHTRHTYTI